MIEYELWLDESGEFNDLGIKNNKRMNPSLIGGVLYKHGSSFSKNMSAKIIKDIYFHSTEVGSSNDVFVKFKKIAEEDLRFVEFSNDEYINIIDTNLTYQNIMALGLVQLFKKLKSETSEDIRIKVVIAERGDCTSENKTNKKVSVEQYEKRIEERLLLEGYRNDISKPFWKIEVADAKKDQRLMIADIVCNSFLTRNTKNKGDASDYINKVRDDTNKTYKFTVFENYVSNQVQNYLYEKRLAEAVFCLIQSENTDYISDKMGLISEYVKSVRMDELIYQNEILMSMASYHINSNAANQFCLRLVDNLIKNWVPVLYTKGVTMLATKTHVDLLFYKITSYTHIGDWKNTKTCEDECDKLMNQLNSDWDSISYKMKYLNRKIISTINNFDFERAEIDCNTLIKRCESIKEALELVNDTDDCKFIELAKAYGTMAQIHMFRIRENNDYYGDAVKCSDAAINEFITDFDKTRQYGYRAQIECDRGNFDEALKYIYMQNEVCENDKLESVIAKAGKGIFKLCSYVRLMAESAIAGWSRSKDLYEELNKTSIIKDIKDNGDIDHPKQIILWKYASYQIINGQVKAAYDNYKQAIELCFNSNELTMNFIGIAIALERYSYALKNNSKESKEFLKELKKLYTNLYLQEMPDSMRRIYDGLEIDSNSWEYFFKMSRKITY